MISLCVRVETAAFSPVQVMEGFIFKGCVLQLISTVKVLKGASPLGQPELPAEWDLGPCHSLEQLQHQVRSSHCPCAHMLHKGALSQLMATVFLAPASKQEAEIVENSLQSNPNILHACCLPLLQPSGNDGKCSISPKPG